MARMEYLFVSPTAAAHGDTVELRAKDTRVRFPLSKGMTSGRVIRLRGAGKRGLFGRKRDILIRVFLLNSLLPVEKPAGVDPELADEVDFVLRYVREGVPRSEPLNVEALYRDYLSRGDLGRLQTVLAASVSEEPVPVEFSAWLEVPGLVRMVERPPVTGVPELPEPRRIFIAGAFREDPLAVGAILAHESAHVFLFRHGYYRVLNPGYGHDKPNQLDRKDEWLTDLAVFGLGWGDLLLNAVRFREGRWWALGYLDAATIRLAAWRTKVLFN
ncbi:hypothetical protein KAU45_02390 [bacterium]|nr:hypothetical protein [bacterium]